MSSKSVIVIIPARYQSSRFPGKSLELINGVSLLQRTYERVLLSSLVTKCIVATDDERIFDHALSFGASVEMTPVDCQTGTDRVAWVVKKDAVLQENSIIVNVQGDEPCLNPKTIDSVVERLLEMPEAGIATAISPIDTQEEVQNPNIVKCVKSTSGTALYFSRQPIPYQKEGRSTPYYRHIGIYAFRPDYLLAYSQLPTSFLQESEDLEMLKALEHGGTIAVTQIERHAPEVNSPKDIIEVEKWIQSFCS